MKKKQTLYLMRHGQTLFNQNQRIQGWCDSPLTELGIYQAKVAAATLRENQLTFDAAYTSTSERACDTLELVTSMPYTRDKRLKEWNFGCLEGEKETCNPPLPYGDFFKQHGGETQDDVQQRISKALEEIMNRENHHNVLVVSHGAACSRFYDEWLEYAQVTRDGRLQNCCILKFDYSDGIFRLVDLWNPEITKITPLFD